MMLNYRFRFRRKKRIRIRIKKPIERNILYFELVANNLISSKKNGENSIYSSQKTTKFKFRSKKNCICERNCEQKKSKLKKYQNKSTFTAEQTGGSKTTWTSGKTYDSSQKVNISCSCQKQKIWIKNLLENLLENRLLTSVNAVFSFNVLNDLIQTFFCVIFTM